MAWRFHGRARVDAGNPAAFGCCDRCSLWYNHNQLHWQFQFAGLRLQNLKLLVCDRCLDVPQPQLKARILPPDPVPIMNARPEFFDIDENTFLVTESGLNIVTENGEYLTTG